jgi:hypothetical protein
MKNYKRQETLFVRIWAIAVAVVFLAACIYTSMADMGPSLGAEVFGVYKPVRPPMWLVTLSGLFAAMGAGLIFGFFLFAIDRVVARKKF